MNFTIKSIKKSVLIVVCLLSSFLSVMADNVQESLNLDYFRTPEASAFKKYGEESVNEYTGTADISVPLYTIKSKDIEIPIVLRYDASGIKVEQEASWVGLGWNLMVGGCINYVCAGSHDMYQAQDVDNKVWTEYLTSEFTPWVYSGSQVTRSRTIYYTYHSNDKFNWMAKRSLNYSNFIESYIGVNAGDGMKEYTDWGYGERDFYSVNVMGKSFMFFIDPFTLKVFNIGKAGEEFVVIPEYSSPGAGTGIGHQPDVQNWKITDSDGYVYSFNVGDKFQHDSRTGLGYTSCWYLTKIQSPKGVMVEFEYTELSKPGRSTMVECVKIPFIHDSGAFCCGDAAAQIRLSSGSYLQSENSGMSVKSHYLSKIRTNNQNVTFTTSNSDYCSGKKLDAIKVESTINNNLIKTITFSYGSFTSSNRGGNYAPGDPSIKSQNRLKLDCVKEIASGNALTTSFSYNETVQLPSKRSCAQDYWGYYNGQENYATNIAKGNNGRTLLPTPTSFMTGNYIAELENIKGADRNSKGEYMQAAILNKVIYPTGGYTTYEYEPNTCAVSKSDADIPYDIDIDKYYSYTPDVPAGINPVNNVPYNFTLTESLDYSLEVRCDGDAINGSSISIVIVSMGLGGGPILFPLRYQAINDYIMVEQGTLPAGDYQLLIGAPGTGNKGYGIHCKLTGHYKSTTSANTYTKTVGGLRVTKVSNFDHDNTLINYTTYSYGGGFLLNRIETIDYSELYNGQPKSGDWSVSNISHSIRTYTITSGHPHMPSFYASCNPGIVGYSRVTKSKYNMNGSLEKKVVTSYRNNSPQTMYSFDYYTSFDNGMISSQQIYNGNILAAEIINDYEGEIVDHYATNIIANNKYANNPFSANSVSYCENQCRYDNGKIIANETKTFVPSNGCFNIYRYPYLLSRTNLAKTITTEYSLNGSTAITAKKYSYNSMNHQVAQIDEYKSDNLKNARNGTSLSNKILRTRIRYTVDEVDTDSKCRSMVNNFHGLNYVVENKKIMVDNGTENCISTQRTAYMGGVYSLSNPISTSTSIGNNTPETRATYTYDGGSNFRTITIDGKETVYLWSYKGQYPIAKIDGLTYAEVKAAIGESTINALFSKAQPTLTDISSIRNAINGARGYITTYFYKPLVGISSETLPNGNTIYYDYDAFGRLETIKDNNKKPVKSYEYKYKR